MFLHALQLKFVTSASRDALCHLWHLFYCAICSIIRQSTSSLCFNLLKHLLELFKFFCFKYNLCLIRSICQMSKSQVAILPFNAFSCAGSSQFLQSVPFWGRAQSTEQTCLLWRCSSCGWNCQPLFHSSYWQETQSSCSMAWVPTALSSAAVWAVRVSLQLQQALPVLLCLEKLHNSIYSLCRD